MVLPRDMIVGKRNGEKGTFGNEIHISQHGGPGSPLLNLCQNQAYTSAQVYLPQNALKCAFDHSVSRQCQNFQASLEINTGSHLLLNFLSGHHSVSCGFSSFHIFFSGSFMIIFSLLNIIHFFCPPFSCFFAFTYPGGKGFRPLKNLSLITKGFFWFQLG